MNYAAAATNTAAVLAKSGTTMSLRVTTPGTYDPATGAETGATTADYATVGVLTNDKAQFVDGTLVRSGDKVILMAASVAVRPLTGHDVVVGSVVWRVIAVDAVEPSGVPVLYKVQVRRG